MIHYLGELCFKNMLSKTIMHFFEISAFENIFDPGWHNSFLKCFKSEDLNLSPIYLS